jgi:hypothetical protein
MATIVGTRSDSAPSVRQWQAVPVNALVLVVLILALVGITAAALMVVAVSLSGKTRD